MDSKKSTVKNKVSRQSPKDVLHNLKTYYHSKIIGSIEDKVDFSSELSFFESLKNFLNDFEEAYIIDKLFHSPIEGLKEEMDLYKRAEQGIIDAVNNPVFLINNDQIDISVATKWETIIENNISTISKVIPSVGRIEVVGDSRWPLAGTGWLIKNTDIIVTNRHVASNFITKNGEGSFVFKNGPRRRRLGVKIDFKEEHNNNTELEFDITEVIHITKSYHPDIALLRVQTKNHNGHKLPEGLELSHDIPKLQENIYIVGYPTCNKDEKTRTTSFNGASGAKQFAPGKFFKTSISDYTYEHNCTTWNGNSGSPLLNFKTGKVLGVHYAGPGKDIVTDRANYAVSVKFLIELLKELEITYTY